MPLTSGIHHVAVVTADLDRLIDFYASVFEAGVIADMDEGGLRRAMIDLGGGVALHPFFVGENPHATPEAGMFQRGHVDHLALNVDDQATFETLRHRLVESGASDGMVTDFGMARTVTFADPDGWEGEIAHWGNGPLVPFEDRIQEHYSGAVTG